MKRLAAPTLALLLLCGACDTPSTEAPQAAPRTGYPALDLPVQPNVLWLVAEDMSPYLSSFGDSTVETPHLDRLANEGVRYTNVFSVSGVCAPSRFSLATGVYTTSAGAHNMRTGSRPDYMEAIGLVPYETAPAPEVRMMSEVLRRHAYYTSNNAKHDYQFTAPVTAWDESSPQAHWRNRPAGMPFFSVFNFGVTHESRIWSKAQDSLWVDENLDVPIPPYLPATEAVRRDVRRLYSNVREMDHQVGKILAELEADGLLDSTIVVFYTDHGGPLPRQKRLLYDSGLHVPMIIRFPMAQYAGVVDDQLVSFVDFAPTTFSLVGIEGPSYHEGRAFLGPARAAEPRRYIHAAADRLDTEYDMIRAVRDHSFKYLRNFQPERGYYLAVTYREQMASMQELLRLRDEGGLDEYQAQWFRPGKPDEELFDTDSDPDELRNLATDPAYSDKLAELRTELDRWMEATNDKGFIPESDLLEQFWPGRRQPVTAAPDAQKDGDRITLLSPTEGASIGYQILAEGEEPGDRWRVYTTPVTLPAGQRLRVVAHRLGYAPSAVVEVR